MIRNFNSMVTLLVLTLFVGGTAWTQSAPAMLQDDSSGKHKPTLAVTVSVQQAGGQSCENLEDLLMVELANQSFLQLVDRQAIHAVIKEHAISLSNLNDTENALALGRFAGADYLLHVLAGKKTASVRLVEVASGQVKLEETVALASDPTMSAVAIREKILAALHPQSQAANRLTVGIAAFSNRSGTDRSDRLGIELQKALRSRLKNEAWAVVLERQYPTALLAEVDLARVGLVREGTVEKLPPADLVTFGSLKDVDAEYAPGKAWTVKLDFALRLRDKSRQIVETFRSDAVEAVAGRIMEKIQEFRRQPTSPIAVTEKELWRRQALYLMPPRCQTWCKAIVPNFFSSSETTKLETIRAWENVLLLKADDLEAMTYLGVCMVGFNRSSSEESVAQCIAGSRLIERALRDHPNEVRADTFISCLPFLNGMSSVSTKRRAKEMVQYILEHPEQFKHSSSYWVEEVLNTPVPEKGGNTPALYAIWKRAVENATEDPNSVIVAFSQLYGGPKFPLEKAGAFLKEHLDSPDPVVRFVAHRGIGIILCRKKDAAGLVHFDKAIEILEEAYSRCNRHSLFFDDIYKFRIEGCQALRREEEARETALSGARHFMDVSRFDESIAWLYHYCVAEILERGQEQEALDICEAYLAGFRKRRHIGRDIYPKIAAQREYLLARLAGKPLPGTGSLRLVKGTEGTDLKLFRMAATREKLWLASGTWLMGGTALLYRPDRDKVVKIPDVPRQVSCVTTMNGSVFFGGAKGLYKLDSNGRLLKHYDQKNNVMPGDRIIDVCEGGGKIYFIFQGSPHLGIAVIDPATDIVSVLAPSGRKAHQEPVNSHVFRLRWDAATPCLYACCYTYWHFYCPTLTRTYGWTPQDKKWQKHPPKESPLLVVSCDNEALLVQVTGDQTQFQFVKAGQKVTATMPVPSLMGEPAWDEQRIWVPSASGLYEVDRATGHVNWLAYQEGNPFFSVLKHGHRLYIATARGLFYRELTATAANENASAASIDPAQTAPGPAALSQTPKATTTVKDSISGNSAPVLPIKLSLEDNAQAEVIITKGRHDTLQKVSPGAVRLDLTTVDDGKHYLYFHCLGYATKLISIKVTDGKASPKQAKIELFRNRYVVLRCAFNTNSRRELDGGDVKEQRLALSHWTGATPFSQDWWICQKSGRNTMICDTPYLEFHRYTTGFGFARPGPGASYENMKRAPASGYRCENIKAEKGLVLYCRVNGNVAKEGLGYGKILVEAITEKPPEDVQIVTRR